MSAASWACCSGSRTFSNRVRPATCGKVRPLAPAIYTEATYYGRLSRFFKCSSMSNVCALALVVTA
eukprot:3484265-Prymnesium_polylepis.1